MSVQGGVGFPNLVLFNSEGTNSMRRWTDSNGVVEYKLFGAPQKRTVPDSAKPVKKEFSVHVTAQPEEVNGNTLLNIFSGGLTFGTAPTKAGGLGSALDIAKTFQYDMGEYFFDLRDWRQQGYRASGQTGEVVYSGVICSFDRPFTIDSTWLGPNNPINFVPAGGTWSFNTRYETLTYRGNGSHTLEGADTDKPRLLVSGTATLTHPLGQLTKTEQWPLSFVDLSPLETNECNEQ